jgi:hypothetical protein
VDVLVRLAPHKAGRHGLETRKGQLPDAVVEALLTHGGKDSAVLLHGGRVSPAMRHRIAEHPDPTIRDAHADFIRTMVELGAPMGIEDLVEAYGRPPAELAAASGPKLRTMAAEAWRDRPMAVQLALLTDPLRPLIENCGHRWLGTCRRGDVHRPPHLVSPLAIPGPPGPANILRDNPHEFAWYRSP